jgi:hypothetical protein
MKRTNRKSVVLVTAIIFIGLIFLMSIAIFSLTTSQITLVNHQVNRVKAMYATEAAMVESIEVLRRGELLPEYVNIDWYYLSGEKDSEGGNVTVIPSIGASGPYGTIPIGFNMKDYSK